MPARHRALPHALRSAPGQRLTRAPIDQMFAVIDTVLEYRTPDGTPVCEDHCSLIHRNA